MSTHSKQGSFSLEKEHGHTTSFSLGGKSSFSLPLGDGQAHPNLLSIPSAPVGPRPQKERTGSFSNRDTTTGNKEEDYWPPPCPSLHRTTLDVLSLHNCPQVSVTLEIATPYQLDNDANGLNLCAYGTSAHTVFPR